MKTKTNILTIAICLLSLTTKAQVDEQTKFEMFCAALANLSTAPNYIVVTVKNIKTHEIKEICTEAPFIEGAMGRETGDWNVDCKEYKKRYFEFSKDSALWNISFDLYSKTELENFAKTINVTEIVQQIKSDKLTTITFKGGNRKEQIMYAHLMFNNGVMMTRGCVGGNICGLKLFKLK